MKLQGIGIEPIPYIPISERETEQPTVFWLIPKTVGLVQNTIDLAQLLELPDKGESLFNKKQLDFLAICAYIENYEFSDSYPDLNKLGTIKRISDKEFLKILVQELEPVIFEEIMNVVDSWSILSFEQKKKIELMTYFALVRNEDMSLQERLSYNCDTCQIMKKHEERICFFLNTDASITFPIFLEQDDFTAEYEVHPEAQQITVSPDEFLIRFWEINQKKYPTTPAYLALQRLHSFMGWEKEVCITGLCEEDYLKVLGWAMDCKTMSALPFPGGYFDQPNQLIEAFNIVNSTISEYERIKLESISSRGKK